MFSATLTIRLGDEIGLIRIIRANNTIPSIHIYSFGTNIQRFFSSAIRLINAGVNFNNIFTFFSAHIESIHCINNSENNISTKMSTVKRRSSSLLVKKPQNKKKRMQSLEGLNLQQVIHHRTIEEAPKEMPSRSDETIEDIIERLDSLHLTDAEDVIFFHFSTFNRFNLIICAWF